MATSNTFRTKELPFAAYLLCSEKAKLIDLQFVSRKGGTIYFIFDLPKGKDEIKTIQLNWTNRNCTVEPKQFCERLNDLRDMMHSTAGFDVVKKEQE